MAENLEEVIATAGDVKIDVAKIHNVREGNVLDIRNFIGEINLYEDLFSPTLMGNIVLSDSKNLITAFPILGSELLTLKLRTTQFDEEKEEAIIYKTFQIYSIENRQLSTDREQSYILSFMSTEGYLDQSVSLSKTFRGKTDELLVEIFEDNLSTDRVIDAPGNKTPIFVLDAPHQSKVTFTACFWSPMRTFNYISKLAKGAINESTDFLFFETNKAFYFTTVETLIAEQLANGLFDEYFLEQPGLTYKRRQNGYTYTGTELPTVFTVIEDITIPKTMDLIESQDSGFYSSAARAFNFTTGQHYETVWDAKKNMPSFKMTGPGLPIPSGVVTNPYANQMFIPLNSYLYDDFEYKEEHISQVLFRKTYLSSLNQYKFRMEIPGRTDIEVGRLIWVNFPNTVEKTDADIGEDNIAFDKLLSGPYLITAIRHKFDNKRHTIIAEIVRNGLQESLGADQDEGVI